MKLFIADGPTSQLNDLHGKYLDNSWTILGYNNSFKAIYRDNRLRRHFANLKLVIRVIKIHKKFEYIYIWEHMIGYWLLLFFKILPIKMPKIILTACLYSPAFKGWRGKLVQFAIRNCSQVVYFNKDFVLDAYRLMPNYQNNVSFHYMPDFMLHDYNEIVTEDLEFTYDVFSGGSAERDFETVVNAFANTNVKVIIVCREKDFNPAWKRYDNITVKVNTSVVEFRDLMKKSRIIIVALKTNSSSCGQITFTTTMRLKKPIIATEVSGTKDYLTHLKNAFLVPCHDANSIFYAYKYIDDNNLLYTQLQIEGYNFYKNNLSTESFWNYLKSLS